MKSFLTLIVFVAVVLAAGLYLVGCAAPEPKIVKQEVRIEVPVVCAPQLPPRPQLMTKDDLKAAMDGAATFDDRVKILAAQVLLYVGWVPVVEAALDGCSRVPATKVPPGD